MPATSPQIIGVDLSIWISGAALFFAVFMPFFRAVLAERKAKKSLLDALAQELKCNLANCIDAQENPLDAIEKLSGLAPNLEHFFMDTIYTSNGAKISSLDSNFTLDIIEVYGVLRTNERAILHQIKTFTVDKYEDRSDAIIVFAQLNGSTATACARVIHKIYKKYGGNPGEYVNAAVLQEGW